MGAGTGDIVVALACLSDQLVPNITALVVDVGHSAAHVLPYVNSRLDTSHCVRLVSVLCMFVWL